MVHIKKKKGNKSQEYRILALLSTFEVLITQECQMTSSNYFI